MKGCLIRLGVRIKELGERLGVGLFIRVGLSIRDFAARR